MSLRFRKWHLSRHTLPSSKDTAEHVYCSFPRHLPTVDLYSRFCLWVFREQSLRSGQSSWCRLVFISIVSTTARSSRKLSDIKAEWCLTLWYFQLSIASQLLVSCSSPRASVISVCTFWGMLQTRKSSLLTPILMTNSSWTRQLQTQPKVLISTISGSMAHS